MSLAPAADIQKGTASGLAETDLTTPSESAKVSTPALDDKGPADIDMSKNKKRSIFGFGKKKTEEKTPTRVDSGLPSPPPTKEASQLSSRRSTTTSPSSQMPSSPGRNMYTSSPRLASPAGSQIFERDVQEPVIIPTSPAIPSHIQVENHIPPALDATSEAITDDHLDPDTVEIVTHVSHQPASVTVTGTSPYETASASSSAWIDELASLAEKEEAASNYGSLDSADVRRLSFISFADVVQAEHGGTLGAASSRDSMYLAGLTSLTSTGMNRSPSPIRSPISSQGAETSPPTSKSGSVKGLDMSPSRKPIGSPTSTHNNLGVGHSAEFNIETMSQALRRTGSSDLSGARSLPVSPIEGPSR